MKAKYILLLMLVLRLAACSEKTETAAATDEKQQTYTCPMHPQIVQQAPGQCPICGMDLVPFDKNNTDATLMLSESQRLLANVVTDTVRSGSFRSVKQLNGRLVTNPESIEMISSRVPGRIEELYVQETGVPVRRGQALYRIYSEQLAALQQEYLVALAQTDAFPNEDRFRQIAEAARQRLQLFDQSAAQLEALRRTRKASPFVTYTAPVSGVVAEVYTAPGQYVAEGSPVLKVEGYGSLWVEADVYPSEGSSARVGSTVTVRIPGYEREPHSMQIDFVAPSLQPGSQLLTLRGRIANPQGRYKAGMQAVVDLPVTTLSDAVTLPVDAVIRDGEGTHVWVEKEPNIFEARTVVTGAENAARVAIKEGLQPGDVAVISGAYLLYSEFVLKKGTTPAGEHNH